jgi:hypothetical protein
MKRLVFVLFLLFISATSIVRAATPPNFSTCPNPGGEVIASYNDGVHAIAGDVETHMGSDFVYKQDIAITQCFCPTDSNDGIQTNWWNASGLTQTEINSFINAGWINIPNGEDWGLANGQYLALNTPFACKPQAGGLGGGNSNPAPLVCTDTKPATPQLLSANRINATTEVITWVQVVPVSYYSISYGTTSSKFQYGVANAGNTTSFTIQALNPGQTYFFGVRAVNGCMPGETSNVLPNGNVLGTSTLSSATSTGTGGQVLGVSTLAATGNDHTLQRVILGLLVGFGVFLIVLI